METVSVSEAARRMGYKSGSRIRQLIEAGRLEQFICHTPGRKPTLIWEGLPEHLARITEWRSNNPPGIRKHQAGAAPAVDQCWVSIAAHVNEKTGATLTAEGAQQLHRLLDAAIFRHACHLTPFTVEHREAFLAEHGEDLAICAWCGKPGQIDMMTDAELEDLKMYKAQAAEVRRRQENDVPAE